MQKFLKLMVIRSVLFIVLFVLFYFGGHTLSSFQRTPQRPDSFEPEDISTGRLWSEAQSLQTDSTISAFLAGYDIVGASVSVARNGRLVYSKGFGYASLEEQQPVTPQHLFRVASVSKLITAVGIMKLVEQQKLDLESQVFGSRGILPAIPFEDSAYLAVQVKHLLNHTAGWSRYQGDPALYPSEVARVQHKSFPISADDLLSYTLAKPLGYKPGSHYFYSNFGFVVLGRIIEEASGMPYEDYIRFYVLQPAGIYDMRLGDSFYDQKYPGEVNYYTSAAIGLQRSYDNSGQMVPPAYGSTDIRLLGAAGGWLASSVSLVRLVSVVDGFPEVKDILKTESIREMVTPDPHSHSLLGWKGSDRYGTWWRTGTLHGTLALVVRQNDNTIWTMITNSTPRNRKIHNRIAHCMFAALHDTSCFTDEDLFARYLSTGPDLYSQNIRTETLSTYE